MALKLEPLTKGTLQAYYYSHFVANDTEIALIKAGIEPTVSRPNNEALAIACENISITRIRARARDIARWLARKRIHQLV